MADRQFKLGVTSSSLRPVRNPTEMELNIGDIDASSTTRTANGKMARTVVRGGNNAIRSISLTWKNVSASDIKQILEIIGNTYFWIRYFDFYTDTMRTAEFYAGDRKATIKRCEDSGLVVGNLEFNAIER